MSYTLGEQVTISAAFAVDGVPSDPGSVTIRVKYGTEELVLDDTTTPPVVKDSTGVYHVTIDTPAEGTYVWRAEGTDPAPGAIEGNFSVDSIYF